MSGKDLGFDQIDWVEAGRRSEERFAELKASLNSAMEPFDAFDILVNLHYANVPFDPETYRESSHPGLLVIPEYVGLLLLGRGHRAGNADLLAIANSAMT